MKAAASRGVPPARKLLAVCLVGVLVCVLLVGAISATFVRHVIQVAPIVLALLAALALSFMPAFANR